MCRNIAANCGMGLRPLEHIRQSSRPGHNIVSRNNHSFTQVDKLRFADASKSYLVIIFFIYSTSHPANLPLQPSASPFCSVESHQCFNNSNCDIKQSREQNSKLKAVFMLHNCAQNTAIRARMGDEDDLILLNSLSLYSPW